MERFLTETGISWPNAYGAVQTLNEFGVTSIPRVFVVGRDGRVSWTNTLGGRLTDAIDKALAASEADR